MLHRLPSHTEINTILNLMAKHPLDDGLKQRNIAQGQYSPSFWSHLVKNTNTLLNK